MSYCSMCSDLMKDLSLAESELSRLREERDKLRNTVEALLSSHKNLYEMAFRATAPEGKPLCVPDDDIVRREAKQALSENGEGKHG